MKKEITVQKNISLLNFGVQANIVDSKEIAITIAAAPLPITTYIGHEEELNYICELAKKDKNISIAGIGGIGKTEFAKMYAYQNCAGQSYLIDYVESFETTFTLSRNSFSIVYGKELLSGKEYFQIVLAKLSSFLEPEDVLIIDNVSYVPDVENALRVFGLPCQILLTTRYLLSNSINCVAFKEYQLGLLTREQAVDLFICYYGRNDLEKEEQISIHNIVDKSARHTITLELLAKTCRVSQTSVKSLSDRIDEVGFNITDGMVDIRKNNDSSNLTFMNHMKKLFDVTQIQTVVPGSRRILKKLSVLSISNMDIGILCSLIDEPIDLVDKLIEAGWIIQDEYSKRLFVHNVMADVMRGELMPQYTDVSDVCMKLTEAQEQKGSYDKIEYLDQIIGMVTNIEEGEEQLVLLAMKTAESCTKQALYDLALKLATKALAVQQTLEGTSNMRTVELLDKIGVVYWNKGKYREALNFYEKSLRVKRTFLEENDISIAYTCNNMAIVFWNNGDYKKAIKYYQKVLKIKKKILPKDDWSIGKTYNNMGLVLYDRGEYNNAIRSYRKALSIYKMRKGNDMLIATTYNNMGMLYRRIGKCGDALTLYESAVEIQKKIVGEEHTATARTYNNMGVVFTDIGEYSCAETYNLRALEIRKRIVGEIHQETAASYNDVARVYNYLGKFDTALEYCNKALEIQNRYWEADHPDKATSYENISIAYFGKGKSKEAIIVLNNALQIRRKALGFKHFEVAIMQSELARFYLFNGETDTAREYYEEAISIYRKVLGEKNELTIELCKEFKEINK